MTTPESRQVALIDYHTLRTLWEHKEKKTSKTRCEQARLVSTVRTIPVAMTWPERTPA